MISTVLPTPAPPNKPILPPRRYGANKSTTLIPVSKIEGFVSNSVNIGAARCIGDVSSVETSPCSSTGSPITLNIRPNVVVPTGTLMGAPKSMASTPRFRPSRM
jgi:hypothetical protein